MDQQIAVDTSAVVAQLTARIGEDALQLAGLRAHIANLEQQIADLQVTSA